MGDGEDGGTDNGANDGVDDGADDVVADGAGPLGGTWFCEKGAVTQAQLGVCEGTGAEWRERAKAQA